MLCGFGQKYLFYDLFMMLSTLNIWCICGIKNGAKDAGCILKCDKMFSNTF